RVWWGPGPSPPGGPGREGTGAGSEPSAEAHELRDPGRRARGTCLGRGPVALVVAPARGGLPGAAGPSRAARPGRPGRGAGRRRGGGGDRRRRRRPPARGPAAVGRGGAAG